MEVKVGCVTGNRPQKFPWNYEDVGSAASVRYHSDLKKLVENLVVKGGFNYFISGGALGVDQDFAEAVIPLRDLSYPNIQLEVAIHCEGQDKLWTPADKKRYKNPCRCRQVRGSFRPLLRWLHAKAEQVYGGSLVLCTGVLERYSRRRRLFHYVVCQAGGRSGLGL